MDKDNVKKSVDAIREECDSIEEEAEPKRTKTYGDPCVTILD